MSEYTALDKHACAACGAPAEWNPAKQALACSYCGTLAPAVLDTDTGKIEEIDLVKTLRELPDSLRGWKAEKRSVKCRSCHAISVFEPSLVGRNCEFCGSPELVDYDEIKAPISPQSILPFRIDKTRVREALARWISGRWFAPGRLKKTALIDTVHGLYIPYWTFDANVRSRWTAESGTYYYVTKSYRDQQGNTRTRQVRRVRWRPASGELEHFFDDEPVPGTHGIELDHLKAVEPFPSSDLVPYDTAYLSGFVVEHYQVVLFDAAQRAFESMNRQLMRLCADQVPGDTYRNLRIDPHYAGQTFKHILVPVWLLSYDYGPKKYQVVVNGYTGKISGRYPKSVWKILGLIGAVAAAAGLLLLLLAV